MEDLTVSNRKQRRFWQNKRVVWTGLAIAALVCAEYAGFKTQSQRRVDAPASPSSMAPPSLPARESTPGGTIRQHWDGLEYVYVPPGSFVAGCTEEPPDCVARDRKRAVSIKSGYWIGRTEVTQAAYSRVSGRNPSWFRRGPSYPVENLSWFDAREYCRAVGLRLPTSAEWEYAARAGAGGAKTHGPVDEIAWHDGNSKGCTHPVASKVANSWAIYDMLGNVAEWVDDAATAGNSPSRVLRGGGWVDEAAALHLARTLHARPALRDFAMGVRCAGESLSGRP